MQNSAGSGCCGNSGGCSSYLVTLGVSEAQEIAFADVILLNKTDLVSESVLEEVGGRIGNECASKIYRTSNAELEMEALWE